MRLVKRNLYQPQHLFPLMLNRLYADDSLVKRSLDRQRDFSNTAIAANIRNEEEQFVIELAAPGFEKEDFKLELNNGVLTIKADKTTEHCEEGEGKALESNYTHREFVFNAFKRTFNIPEEAVEIDGIKAEYQAGILNIVLPKKEIKDTKRNFEVL